MIRITLLWLFVAFLAVYSWRDWYKACCGLILLMAVVEHPDMPKSMLGIQGLNPWNILLAAILPAWLASRRLERLRWDMPTHVSALLLAFLAIIVIGVLRLLHDPGELIQAASQGNPGASDDVAGIWSEKLINSVKWVIPGLLLYDGCRDSTRFKWGAAAVLSVYLLLAVQVIRWMPLDAITSGAELTERSLKIILNEIGFHRVNLAVMLAGGAWAFIAASTLATSRTQKLLAIAASLTVIAGIALTGGRAGYSTWVLVGLVFALLRWKKYLLLAPLLALMVVAFVPAVAERFTAGFSSDSYDSNPLVQREVAQTEGEIDAYTVTAGRNVAWPHVIEKIGEAPLLGYGREAMLNTGITAMLWDQYRENFPHPHNAYLQLLLDNGLLGTVPILLLFGIILRNAFSLFRDSRNPIFVAAGGIALALVLALMIGGISSQTFYPREGAMGMWCAIGLMLRVYVDRARILAAVVKSPAPRSAMVRNLWPRTA